MKKFFREHGIWVLFATAVIAVSLSLMSFFSNTSSPLSNLAGIIASPFRSAYTTVTGWITDKQNYYQDVTALEEEHPDLRLLGPLTFPLGLWALKQYAFLLPAWDLSQFSWLLSWLALAVELTTLYFHFQFLTDLADIAARHAGETGRDFSPALLRARTVVTVLSTAASVLFYLGVDSSGPLSSFSIALTLFLLVVLVVQILCTTVLLFRFSSALRRAGPVLPEGPGI